ncbi:helix-turn-helix transcriptional regulator [Paenibacillus sp. GCM10012307]|uniref:DeoR family transcriptional regulator n=1 Tax=Paenibacillus roseus TaxID=2798579 RepID=A0A934J852_9BACL|nr:DeoR family transcriptional regulator [Paenibacillus roseus]MBJ6363544.1 DeoR family transcriptional regulator [Paenibacillus roseus]
MKQKESNKESATKTRRAIIDMLKQRGGMDVLTLASEFSLSGMAIRKQLNMLEEEGVVTSIEEARPMGRPAKLWVLTSAANQFFPSGYSDLSISLIQSIEEAFGHSGLDRLLEVRNANMKRLYSEQISETYNLKERLVKLASIRTREGYLAEVQEQEDGSYLMVEKHCPICEAAAACAGLCKNELQLFRTILGEGVHIERIEHIVSGGRRCVYSVKAPYILHTP